MCCIFTAKKMLTVQDILHSLNSLAPGCYQESYDNSRLLCGSPSQVAHAALLCLDCTEAVVDEAIAQHCNVIIAHHPIVFKGLKALTGQTYVERVLIKAIQHQIAIVAVHTNLDNQLDGVNRVIANRLGLVYTRILKPMLNTLELVVREPLLILGSLTILLSMSPRLTLFLLLVLPVHGGPIPR